MNVLYNIVIWLNEKKPAATKENKLKAWIKEDAKAKLLISASMEPDEIMNFVSCTTSKEIVD